MGSLETERGAHIFSLARPRANRQSALRATAGARGPRTRRVAGSAGERDDGAVGRRRARDADVVEVRADRVTRGSRLARDRAHPLGGAFFPAEREGIRFGRCFASGADA